MNQMVFPECKTQLRSDDNKLQLQCCSVCEQVNYPPRELCGNCLSDALNWQRLEASGSVQALTLLQHSMEAAFADALPLQIVSVQLTAGPVLICHGVKGLKHGQSVTVSVMQDRDNNYLLFATDSALDDAAIADAWAKTGLV
jgi:uncharacterized OB-fold protein